MKQQDFIDNPNLINETSLMVDLICDTCNNIFTRDRCDIVSNLKSAHYGKVKTFCSMKCYKNKDRSEFIIIKPCANCGKETKRSRKEMKKNKSGNIFCSSSCAATYNNTHKTTGNRRSKLEIWLEQELTKLYPNLEMYYNKKNTINAELDIYIPSLFLAIELNGIFHYEPIYGPEKLSQIENNDNRKIQACLEKNIELCIIDTSKMKKFKKNNAIPYLNIITNIINNKLD